jgi:hypothetical protein
MKSPLSIGSTFLVSSPPGEMIALDLFESVLLDNLAARPMTAGFIASTYVDDVILLRQHSSVKAIE